MPAGLQYNIPAMDTTELLKTRRAIRRYQNKPVSKTQVTQLLELACWAPSAHNRQPWRFAVLTQPADKIKLAQTMGNRLRQDRTADSDPPADIEYDVARSYSRLTGAPVVIMVCLSMADMDTYPDARRNHNEWVMAVQSVSMAAQNLWLAAHNQGLAMCWLCAPLFVPELVKETLNLPTDWEPLGLMTLGYPAEEKVKTRRPLPENVIWI
jgi:F420 biosynthesis protein FbiB-like protein